MPGGPTSSTPFGILPPRLVYFSRVFRNSTISRSSCAASSTPATSWKLTLTSSSEKIFALLRAKRHHAAFGAADAAEEERPQADEQQDRDDPAEHLGQPAADHLAAVLHAAPARVPRPASGSSMRVVEKAPWPCSRLLEHAADVRVADGHLRHLPAADQRLELAVGNLPAAGRQEQGLADRQHAAARQGPTTAPSAAAWSGACPVAGRIRRTGQPDAPCGDALPRPQSDGGLRARLRRSDLREAERSPSASTTTRSPSPNSPVQDPHRQRVQHQALEGPLQRPGAVDRIIPFPHQQVLGRRRSAPRGSSAPRAA